MPLDTRQPSKEDFRTKWVVLKDPQTSYKIGMYKDIFPNARFKYILVLRSCEASLNGLMDGWNSPWFHSYDVSLCGAELDIEGYSGKRFWKFDLPPNWREYTDKPLVDVCFNQWYQAYKHILGWCERLSHNDVFAVRFEELVKDPNKVIGKITHWLNIPSFTITELLHTMVTEGPDPERWRKKRPWLEDYVSGKPETREIQERLSIYKPSVIKSLLS